MTPEPFDAQEFVRTLVGLGWRRGEPDSNLLLHPEDHALCLRYDPPSGRITVSPELDAWLDRVIPTPVSRSRVGRRDRTARTGGVVAFRSP